MESRKRSLSELKKRNPRSFIQNRKEKGNFIKRKWAS